MKTAMQDLREDLVLTQVSAKDALLDIENQEIRKACQEVLRLTLNNIIKRIDEELLELEKQQQGYSEEDMEDYSNYCWKLSNDNRYKTPLSPKEWFEQFKNK